MSKKVWRGLYVAVLSFILQPGFPTILGFKVNVSVSSLFCSLSTSLHLGSSFPLPTPLGPWTASLHGSNNSRSYFLPPLLSSIPTPPCVLWGPPCIAWHFSTLVDFPILFRFLLCTHSGSFSGVGGIIVTQRVVPVLEAPFWLFYKGTRPVSKHKDQTQRLEDQKKPEKTGTKIAHGAQSFKLRLNSGYSSLGTKNLFQEMPGHQGGSSSFSSLEKDGRSQWGCAQGKRQTFRLVSDSHTWESLSFSILTPVTLNNFIDILLKGEIF